MYNIKQN